MVHLGLVTLITNGYEATAFFVGTLGLELGEDSPRRPKEQLIRGLESPLERWVPH